MKRVLIVAIACAVPFWSGCAGTARPEPEYRPDEDRSVVIDRANRSVRFSGIVPIDASRQPMLEVLVCTPNTREHEALVMTSVRPSHIHAALIALGAEPGRTGGLVWNGSDFEMREPRGDRIGVRPSGSRTHPLPSSTQTGCSRVRACMKVPIPLIAMARSSGLSVSQPRSSA